MGRARRTVEQIVQLGRVVDDLGEGLCDLRAVAHVLRDGGKAGSELERLLAGAMRCWAGLTRVRCCSKGDSGIVVGVIEN